MEERPGRAELDYGSLPGSVTHQPPLAKSLPPLRGLVVVARLPGADAPG